MDIHKNARLTPLGRERMVNMVLERANAEGRRCKPQAFALARCANGSSASKPKAWPACRIAARGPTGCVSRRRRPSIERIDALRRQRLTGKADRRRTRRLARHRQPRAQAPGPQQAEALEPAEPVRRYEREQPGELIHIDIKKLGRFDRIGHRITGDRTGQSNSRGVGWEFVHVCIDDASRIAFSQIMPDRSKRQRRRLPQGRRRLLCKPRRHRRARHDRQRLVLPILRLPQGLPGASASSTSAPGPTRPRPTARPSASSRPRCANGPMPAPTPPRTSAPPSCPSVMHRYNWHRPHGSIGAKPPISQTRPDRGQPVEAPQLAHDLAAERPARHALLDQGADGVHPPRP